MGYQNVTVCIIIVINLACFKCYLWDSLVLLTPQSTMKQFRKLLRTAGNIVVFTGAGISTDSGIMTYRGSWGYWRKWNCRDLDVSSQFTNLSTIPLAWEFNNYRRDYILHKEPNIAHYAIVELEKYLQKDGREFTLITLNTDGLHSRAGSKNIIELFGSVWQTECMGCGDVETNMDNPICPALAHASCCATLDGMGVMPPPELDDLPHCNMCKGMLKPYITFLDEQAKFSAHFEAYNALMEAELVIMIGISFSNITLSPFTYNLILRNVPVAEFNIQKTGITSRTEFHFRGRAKDTVPQAFFNLSDTWDL